MNEVLWCDECHEAVRNTIPAYLRHSTDKHHGGGWRETLVSEVLPPQPVDKASDDAA